MCCLLFECSLKEVILLKRVFFAGYWDVIPHSVMEMYHYCVGVFCLHMQAEISVTLHGIA